LTVDFWRAIAKKGVIVVFFLKQAFLKGERAQGRAQRADIEAVEGFSPQTWPGVRTPAGGRFEGVECLVYTSRGPFAEGRM